MAWYIALGPITYTNGNTIISSPAGARVDLTNAQANTLTGQIALVGGGANSYPNAPVLYYDYFLTFPANGDDQTIYFALDTGDFYYWSDTASAYVQTGTAVSQSTIATADYLTNGMSTMSRREITGSAVVSDGVLVLSYFTASGSGTFTQLKTLSGSQAQVGASLARMGIYAVNDAGSLSLLGATPNNASSWNTTATAYQVAMSSSVAVVAGTRYAIGALAYGTSTPPSYVGAVDIPGAEALLSPTLGAQVTGQTDLPSTVQVANLAATSLIPYACLLP